MAEACRIESHKAERKTEVNQDESFCIFNVLCVFISLTTVLADLTTDILVFAEYCNNGNGYWAVSTLIFILVPNILINIFSLRWFLNDRNLNIKHWITHCCLGGLLQRAENEDTAHETEQLTLKYVIFLHKTFACQSSDSVKLTTQRNDLSLLHFLYVFTGTVPQIILQTYAVLTFDDNYQTKLFALFASIASVMWGCIIYIYSIMNHSSVQFQWISFFLKLFWHSGMLVARIFGILLFTIIFGIWTLLPLGLHWIAMTFWIIVQNTTFCPSKLEETLYNVVMGFVYCFCYINLREGHTRYRIMMFCTLMVTQNFGSLLLYILISDFNHQNKSWSIGASICIIIGTILGISAMIIYYRYFHSKGPIAWKHTQEDIELNNKISTQKNDVRCNETGSLRHVRSFKSTLKHQTDEKPSLTKISNAPTSTNEKENADKKFLLDHWVARCGTPTFTSAPVTNNSMECSSIEIYTTENTPQSIDIISKSYKKVTICSPTQLHLKLNTIESIESSIDDIARSNLNLQKRRGICSSDELSDDLTNLNLDDCDIINDNFGKNKIELGSIISHETDGSNKKTSSDSIDMDLDLSFSDINSSDINTFNENIVQKLCLSALKNIKVGNQDADIENIQRIALDILKEMYTKKDKSKNVIHTSTLSCKRDLDTPTELLSVHDYENICAVNIAREAWGLRSWNGYCDIENWLHDGSVVRDRRRDTLTSASTEISSCISQDLRNAILSAPVFPKKTPTYSNIYIKFDKGNQDDYVNTGVSSDELFLAKPCVVDAGKDTHLEPIMEELDDLGDVETVNKKRLNSESSLVATIDEIRKATATNSPRNLFHRREPLWDSPQINTQNKIESSLQHALWKEPFKLDSSNILESLPEKENIADFRDSKYDFYKKDIYLNTCSVNIELNARESNSDYCKNTRRRQKSNSVNIKSQTKKIGYKTEHLQDLSNKDIDFLWQLVSENSMQLSSSEDLSANRRTSSLQSLIHKEAPTETTQTTKQTNNNIKRGSKRPRRKFSLLRDRFEPKSNLQSDEEILCHGSDSHIQNIDGAHVQNFVKLKNELRITERAGMSSEYPDVNVSNNVNEQNPTIQDSNSKNISKSIREKRSIFMKQVLSPPKFNTKLRYKI